MKKITFEEMKMFYRDIKEKDSPINIYEIDLYSVKKDWIKMFRSFLIRKEKEKNLHICFACAAVKGRKKAYIKGEDTADFNLIFTPGLICKRREYLDEFPNGENAECPLMEREWI